MTILSTAGAKLPNELTDICDSFLLPVSISLSQAPGMPIVYANQPFEYLTGYNAKDVLGLNFKYLLGQQMESAASESLVAAVASHERIATCVASRRSDNSSFFQLIAFQPLELPHREIAVIACHAAFQPFSLDDCTADTAFLIAQSWQGIRKHQRLGENVLTEHDTYRLEAISMRFEAVFTRAQNALIKRMAEDTSAYMKYMSSPPGPVELNRSHSAAAPAPDTPFDLGPLTKAPSASS